MQGNFFNDPAALTEFRRILGLAAAGVQALQPGATVFTKGGSIDVPGFHCLCLAGGMFFADRWAYYTMTINWEAPGENYPGTVGATTAAVLQALELTRDGLSS